MNDGELVLGPPTEDSTALVKTTGQVHMLFTLLSKFQFFQCFVLFLKNNRAKMSHG